MLFSSGMMIPIVFVRFVFKPLATSFTSKSNSSIAASILIRFFSRTFPHLNKKKSLPVPVLSLSRCLSSSLPLMLSAFLTTSMWNYCTFPVHPHIFIRSMVCSFTAFIAAIPSFSDQGLGFSFSNCFSASVYATRNSVAKFTLHIPRCTHSTTSSSLSPLAP